MTKKTSQRALAPGVLKKRLFWGPLLIILLVWALLYLPHLRTSPGWYGDEILAFDAGTQLLQGHPAMRALYNTFWHTSGPYQPGYILLSATAGKLAGGDLVGARFFNTLLALGIALVVYFYGRALLGILPAFWSSLIFLTYEQSIIHFRWNFAHNLIAFGFTVAFLALCRPPRRKNDFLAGMSLALAASAYLPFVYGMVPAGLVRWKHPRSWPWLFGPPVLVVLGSLLLGFLLFPPGNFLLSDVAATVRLYLEGSKANGLESWRVFKNIGAFFSMDPWHLAGGLAFFLCFHRRFFPIGVAGLIIAFLLLQNRANLTVFYYQAVMLLPLMVLAGGVAMRRGVLFLRKSRVGRATLFRAQGLLFLLPLLNFSLMVPKSFTGSFYPRNDHWTAAYPEKAEDVARWVHARTSPEDLVISSPVTAWLLHARVADYAQAANWEGRIVWPFNSPTPRERFRYPADISRARFAIVSDFDVFWTFKLANITPTVTPITEHWKRVYDNRGYHVMENPQFAPPNQP